ncbi:MAG TPA: LLM class flavin-dependent oxidoreductase [Solirubrobacteraceae bacterium]|jgi:coenzyme F420-dependent glucose-6-phosphate dehydrogenase|nr:LLM class flavin-dependent oxidoreductase [Solirubrobacteraceae bacterium]
MTPRFWFAGSHEEFTPSALLEQAVAAEAAGFDGIGCSDHFAPWFPDGESGNAWVWLGAVGALTGLPIGTGVTPVIHRYHPGVIAQAFMSLEEMFPGRVFLGAGSGESLNESPLGLAWPRPAEQLARFDAGLDAIRRLWAGETVTMDGGWFRLDEAKLYTRASAPPKLYVSAFGPQAARIAGRHGDGLWTLGDPEQAPVVIEAYRESCAEHDRPVGEIILQTGIAWAATEAEAIAGARRWKPTQLSSVYRDDIHDPAEMQEIAEREYTDDEFAHEGFVVSAAVEHHITRLRELCELGPTVICTQLIGQADPMGTIRTYGQEVLPALRES